MSKIETVRAAMMQAMKEKDKPRKDALSSLLAALKAKAIDLVLVLIGMFFLYLGSSH